MNILQQPRTKALVPAEKRMLEAIASRMRPAVFLLAISLLLPAITRSQIKLVRRVLILNELGPIASPAINLIDGEIRARLEGSPYQIELYTESLETTLFPDPGTQKEFLESYIHKYRERKPDVIIAVGPSPLHFLAQSQEKFFPNAPVVFCVSTPGMVGNPKLNSSFTGVWEMPDFLKTLELAVKLLPDTRHIVVVGGVASYDRANEAIVRDGLRRYEARFEVTYLTDLDMPTLLERLKRLPEDSIVLQAGISEDAAGTRYVIATQSNPMVAQGANAPVFPAGAMADVDVGQGAIGGYLISFSKEAQIAAADTARILNGEKPKDIPIVRGANAYIFDWRALKRWGLKEADLPPGSLVLYRQPSFFELYRRYIVLGLLLFLAQLVAIAALLWQRAQTRKAERAVRESEERLRMAVQGGKMFAFDWDVATDVIVRSEEVTQIPGLSGEPTKLIKQQLLTRVHPEDRATFNTTIAECTPESPNHQISFRLLRPDGSVVWLERTGHAFFDEQGKMVRMIGMVADVTERKLAESELALANDRLRLAMESGKSVGWDRDVKSGRDILFGDLQSIFGMPLETYVGCVEDFHRLVHPEDRGRIVKAVDDAMESRKPYAAELRVLWPDGTVRWLSAKGKFYYSPDGEPERMLGMAVDITERKLVEVALHESEQRLRLAAQAGKMYAIDWDVATDMVIRSEEAAHILGLSGEPIRLTHEQMLGRVHPEDRATFDTSIAELTPESPNTQISFRVLRPDGSVLWLERTGHAFFDEQSKMVRMIGMVADITERKSAEDKLHEYERTVEGLEEMIAVIDREYRYLIANSKFCRIRNMTREQVVGRFAYEVLNKEVFEAVVKERIDECFQGKVVRYEMKYTYPELGERDVLVSYFPIEGATRLDRVACIVQDITERKQAEEALSTVSQRLIEAHEEERTRLARELHDDINQRLALLAVSLNDLKQSLPAVSIELGRKIDDASKQIGDVGNDVQALSHRLHSSKLEYLGLERAASGFCREFSDQQGVEIDFHSENVPNQLAPEISLSLFRVLQEALQNAAKHSGARQFQVSLKGQANEVELTVHDSGIGFDPEQAIKGRGLGLTSMRERLKLVGGELLIDSRLHRGTTVHAGAPLSARPHSALVGGQVKGLSGVRAVGAGRANSR